MIDVSGFTSAPVLDGTRWLVTVKSLDQVERRRSMLDRQRTGQVGRLAPRPVADGLLVDLHLRGGEAVVAGSQPFREPRHIVKDGLGYLLTECGRVVHLNRDLAEIGSTRGGWFAFLHTVDIDEEGRRLIASAGYDCVISRDQAWSAWEHGFNPTSAGVWLTDDETVAAGLEWGGMDVLLVDPSEYGEQGLVTSGRTAHISCAVWSGDGGFLFIAGKEGAVYRVGPEWGRADRVLSDLGRLPHGLRRLPGGGWTVTLTTRGEWRVMDDDFETIEEWSVADVSGKHPAAGDAEWVQQAIPAGGGRWLLLDANRGLIAVDVVRETICRYSVPAEWCLQDALMVEQ